jgi:hypothetical protein
MATISELQKAINEKRIDTRQLSSEQLGALDQAFKAGELKGYEGIEDYQRLISLGAESVAGVKQKRLEGFEAATGLTRGNFELFGAAGGSMLAYYKNRDALIDAFTKNGYKDIYGVDTRFNGLGEIYKNRFTVLGDAIKKLPKVRGPIGAPVRMLGNLAGMVDNTIDFFTKLGRYGASAPLRTLAEDIALGGLGAGAGSASYDIANLGSDFVAATSADMANLTDNDIRKLPFENRVLFNALSATYNDMLWAGAATGLLSTVRAAGKEGLKNSLGLNSEQSKEIARSFERLGMKPNLVSLIPGKGAFQNFFKKFFTTIGVYPLVSGPLDKFNRKFNRKLTQEQFLDIVDYINLSPGSNQAIMNYAGANQIRREWSKTLESISAEYKNFRDVYESIGNPAIIPTANLKEVTQRLVSDLERMYPENTYIWSGLQKGARELTDVDDPMMQLVKYYSNLNNYIRLSDWQGLARMQTNAYSNTKFKGVRDTLKLIRNSLERDLNSMGEATVRSNLKDKILKEQYQSVLNSEGPQAAEAFLDTQIRISRQAFQKLKEANYFYSTVLTPFQKSKASRELRKSDSKLFADAGIEITGQEGLYPDQIFDKAIRNIFNQNSPAAMKQLKIIMGVTKSSYPIVDEETGKVIRTVVIPNSKEAKEMYDRYTRTWFWDAWNEATTKPLRDFRSISLEAATAEAAKRGFRQGPLFGFEDDLITQQRIRAKARTNEVLDVTEISPEIFTKSTIANLNDGVIRNHDFGEVNINQFKKNLGIDTTSGRDTIIEIFGGGQQGKKALKRIDDVIKVKEAIDSVDLTDPSKFVQRSLTLRGAGGIQATATAAAFGIGNTLKLVLGGRIFGSQILLNPKLAEHVMEMNKYMRFTDPGPNQVRLSPQMAPKATRTFVRFINSLMEAEGDDFRVDPNKIDFEEIRQKIISLDPNIELFSSYDFNTMPKFTRDRMFPNMEIAKKLNPEVAREAERYFQGANLMALSEQNFNQIANSNPMLQATEPAAINQAMQPAQATAPEQMATQPMPQDTGQQAQTYAALFPQDTLGQAVAARQFNEGGFVEDIYAQADEVLNG